PITDTYRITYGKSHFAEWKLFISYHLMVYCNPRGKWDSVCSYVSTPTKHVLTWRKNSFWTISWMRLLNLSKNWCEFIPKNQFDYNTICCFLPATRERVGL
ncbi:hypothetical protein CRM22_000328, partial [Opisthorchis felineus]